MLRRWANRPENSGPDQTKVSTRQGAFADLGGGFSGGRGGQGAGRAPSWAKISSLSCVFREKLVKQYVGALPPPGMAPSLREILDLPLADPMLASPLP